MTDKKIFKLDGREFDVSTAEGLKEAQVWAEASESFRGRLANQVGELKKEVEPLRKYNLKGTSIDENAVRSKVAELRAEGLHDEADAMLFEYADIKASVTARELEKERLWEDYKAARKDIFEVLPEDMAKDYVFRNYGKDLSESDNPFDLVDKVLKPKAAKYRKPEEPAAVAAGGTTPLSPSTNQKEEKPSAMANVLAEFGFE